MLEGWNTKDKPEKFVYWKNNFYNLRKCLSNFWLVMWVHNK